MVILIGTLLCAHAVAQSERPSQAPEIETQKKSPRPPKDKGNAEQRLQTASSNPSITNSTTKGTHVDLGGSEFWPMTFYGLRLKVTDSLLVLFTFTLAIFTGLLWYSTEKVWTATALNAQVLVNAERPQLLMDNVKLHGLKREGFREAAATVHPNLPSNQPMVVGVTYGIKNYGKSPAWPTKINANFEMLEALPPQPKYGKSTTKIIGPVVAGNFIEGKQMLKPNPNVTLTNEQRADIYLGKQNLFLWGFVEYTDFSRRPQYMSRFAYKYIVGEGWDMGDRFDPCGPDSYWGHT